jgi:hypothetical protein
MKDYTNKYIKMYNESMQTLTIMFVQEQESLDIENEHLFTGVGCLLDGRNFQATTYMMGCAVTEDCVIEEITRKKFLELRKAMWATFLVKLTRKTFRLEQCKK